MRFAAALLSLLACTATASRRFGHHVQNVLDDHVSSSSQLQQQGGDSVVQHFYKDAVLDHFDSVLGAKQETWNQRFYYDDRFWCGEGCPIFLYIGGEGPQGPPTSKLFMWTLAEENGALMVALEHRF